MVRVEKANKLVYVPTSYTVLPIRLRRESKSYMR